VSKAAGMTRSGPAPILAWRYNKKRMEKTAAIAFAMAMLFGVFSVVHWFGAAMALFVAGLGVTSLVQANSKKPVLSVGPDGLFYARFSARPVPWSEIAEVVVVRGVRRGVAWGKVYYAPSPMSDEISFSLKSYDGYSGALRNALRGFRAMMGLPGVRCVVWHLDAQVDDVARAIDAHWRGAIQDKVPREGRVETTPWTGTPPPIA